MTLIDLYTQRGLTLDQRESEARTSLATEKSNLDDQQENLELWTDRATKIGAEIKASESRLLTAVTGADIEMIAVEVRGLKIEHRTSLGRMHGAQLEVQKLRHLVDQHLYDVDLVSKHKDENADDLEWATELEAKHQSWFANIAVDPLASTPATANTLLTGVVDQALTKLEAETSSEFMSMVKNRAEKFWQRETDFLDKAISIQSGWDANWIVQYGLGGNIEIKSRNFDAAVTTLREFISSAESLVEGAEPKARKIIDAPLLSAAQKLRFDTLMADGDVPTDVLTPETTYRDAAHELLIRQRELAEAQTTVRASDPGISDVDLASHPDVDAILSGSDGKAALAVMQTDYDNARSAIGIASFDDVLAKETDLNDAETALQDAVHAFLLDNPGADPNLEASLDVFRDGVSDAQDALDAAIVTMKATSWYKLEQLEVAIPDDAWRDLMHVVRVRVQLDKLKDVVPTDLQTALTTAEDELSTAINEEFDITDGYQILDARVDEFTTFADLTITRGAESVFGIIRGLS